MKDPNKRASSEIEWSRRHRAIVNIRENQNYGYAVELMFEGLNRVKHLTKRARYALRATQRRDRGLPFSNYEIRYGLNVA